MYELQDFMVNLFMRFVEVARFEQKFLITLSCHECKPAAPCTTCSLLADSLRQRKKELVDHYDVDECTIEPINGWASSDLAELKELAKRDART